jgi:hypothetical protein
MGFDVIHRVPSDHERVFTVAAILPVGSRSPIRRWRWVHLDPCCPHDHARSRPCQVIDLRRHLLTSRVNPSKGRPPRPAPPESRRDRPTTYPDPSRLTSPRGAGRSRRRPPPCTPIGQPIRPPVSRRTPRRPGPHRRTGRARPRPAPHGGDEALAEVDPHLGRPSGPAPDCRALPRPTHLPPRWRPRHSGGRSQARNCVRSETGRAARAPAAAHGRRHPRHGSETPRRSRV